MKIKSLLRPRYQGGQNGRVLQRSMNIEKQVVRSSVDEIKKSGVSNACLFFIQ